MEELIVEVEREVLGWPGTISEPGRFDCVAFRSSKREIGHVHREPHRGPAGHPGDAGGSAREGQGEAAPGRLQRLRKLSNRRRGRRRVGTRDPGSQLRPGEGRRREAAGREPE